MLMRKSISESILLAPRDGRHVVGPAAGRACEFFASSLCGPAPHSPPVALTLSQHILPSPLSWPPQCGLPMKQLALNQWFTWRVPKITLISGLREHL